MANCRRKNGALRRTYRQPIDQNAFGRIKKGKKLDIIKNEKEWIEATQHQAFTDIVVEASTEMMKCLDLEITKAVGFDNSLRDEDEETDTQNELNDIVAKVLFESLSQDQFISLIKSHDTDPKAQF
jgi:hypothetical protein